MDLAIDTNICRSVFDAFIPIAAASGSQFRGAVAGITPAIANRRCACVIATACTVL